MQEVAETNESGNQEIGSTTGSLPPRPGYKTTEFYVIAAAIIGQISAVHTGAIPGAMGAGSISITAIAYLFARILVKELIQRDPALAPVAARIEETAEQLAPLASQIAGQSDPSTVSTAAPAVAQPSLLRAPVKLPPVEGMGTTD